MTDQTDRPPAEEPADTFRWHPEYATKRFDEVQAELASEIASDQRSHRLAMEGAEDAEQDALVSVVNLERKWGPYDFDWAEQDPDELASRIIAFERERERRKEMITWSDYRTDSVEDGGLTDAGEGPAPDLSTSMKAISLIIVALLILVILLAVWAL